MSIKLFDNSSLITFSADQRIPYGKQITLFQSTLQSSVQAISAMLPDNTFSDIKIEGEEVHLGSFIVMQSKPIGKKAYRHLAVNSNSLDLSSESIEHEAIEELTK